ncbi:MAG: hypothetical protein MZV64_09245 [Ignavibacteriales bacterium]|nr:hypothetical protein [Ignavibacteriales bacterium]
MGSVFGFVIPLRRGVPPLPEAFWVSADLVIHPAHQALRALGAERNGLEGSLSRPAACRAGSPSDTRGARLAFGDALNQEWAAVHEKAALRRGPLCGA